MVNKYEKVVVLCDLYNRFTLYMDKISLIYITCSDKVEAKSIAKHLIKEKLVACANIIDNVISIFEYDDKFCEEKEVILILKTLSTHFEKVKNRVVELHSYDVPCIVEIDVSNSSKEFSNWLKNSIASI
ncbi:MAG: periplasmic divalent cation tolerance protein [Candidatus Midichloriaceae bacterium]